jgi:hypothetical protein
MLYVEASQGNSVNSYLIKPCSITFEQSSDFLKVPKARPLFYPNSSSGILTRVTSPN